eukprot:TRINITY_DN5562_c0_g1_i1.p1 TRINITY_DN5562_c0_g1~~TRINITY_DN5562_c0_g1_i1.p1  ORF type:complete len:619 (+),score=149.29 TRINITY_DN5562_c0_g1_i1:36-1859(+)
MSNKNSSSKVSFTQIMDEELARKLQAEEDELHAQEQRNIQRVMQDNRNSHYQNEDDVSDEEDDTNDEYFYEDTSSLPAYQQTSSQPTDEPPEDAALIEQAALTDEELARQLAEEEDYLSALRLQQDIDDQKYAYDTEARRRQNSGSKVGVYTIEEMYRGAQRPRYAPPDDADDEFDNTTPNPIKSNNSSKKKKKAGPTKHDIDASSRYNADNLDKFMEGSTGNQNMRLPTSVYNSLKEHSRQTEADRIRFKSKEDHASYEQALDPRTRLILYKMLNTGLLDEVNGVISTGKEANVYHAHGPCLVPDQSKGLDGLSERDFLLRMSLIGGEYAIKIFKTTLNEFRNREEYTGSEYRFKNDRFSNQNPRKVIKLWAQKEMRNLKRLIRAGISCPVPVLLREHVLIMSFIGQDTKPAPKLADISVSSSQFKTVYYQVIKMMRRLYQTANLVHADMSEYNILYFDKTPYIIDVSQAVEIEHENSLEFLRRDCQNISAFFSKRGVEYCMNTRQLFEFITDKEIENEDRYIVALETKIEANPEPTPDEIVQAEVFRHAYIPHNAWEIKDLLQEQHEARSNKNPDIFHSTVTGVRYDSSSQDDTLDDSEKTDDEE